jgi:hypothetical protein
MYFFMKNAVPEDCRFVSGKRGFLGNQAIGQVAAISKTATR